MLRGFNPRAAESAPLIEVWEDDGGRDATSFDVEPTGLAQRFDPRP
jgi:hypothetical protein